jgi:hypothetical protein
MMSRAEDLEERERVAITREGELEEDMSEGCKEGNGRKETERRKYAAQEPEQTAYGNGRLNFLRNFSPKSLLVRMTWMTRSTIPHPRHPYKKRLRGKVTQKTVASGAAGEMVRFPSSVLSFLS